MPVLTYDDVVEYFDLKELSRTNEVAGNFDVGFRWGGFSARVIVHDHDSSRSDDHCGSEYFPGMNQDCIQRPDGHQLVSLDPTPGVQHHDREALAVGIGRESRLHRTVPRLNGGFASPIPFIRGLGASLSTRMTGSGLVTGGCSTVWKMAKPLIF